MGVDDSIESERDGITSRIGVDGAKPAAGRGRRMEIRQSPGGKTGASEQAAGLVVAAATPAARASVGVPYGPPLAPPGGCHVHQAMPCFCCPPPSLLGAQPLLSLHPAVRPPPHHGYGCAHHPPPPPASVFAAAQAAADTRRRWQQQVCAATTQPFSRSSRAAHAFDPDMTPGAASPTSRGGGATGGSTGGGGGTPAAPSAREQRQLLAALRCASAIAAGGDAKECLRCSYVDAAWRVDAATGGCCARAPPKADPIFESLLKYDGGGHDPCAPCVDPPGGPCGGSTPDRGGIKEALSDDDEGGGGDGGDGEQQRRQQRRHENKVVGQLAALLVMTRKYNNQYCKSAAGGAEPCEWAAVQKCLFAHRPREVRRDPLDFFRRHGSVYSHAPCPAVLGGAPCHPMTCPYAHSAVEQEMHPLQLLRELSAAAAAERAAAAKQRRDEGDGNTKDEEEEDDEVVAVLPGTLADRDGEPTSFDDQQHRWPRGSLPTPPPPPPHPHPDGRRTVREGSAKLRSWGVKPPRTASFFARAENARVLSMSS